MQEIKFRVRFSTPCLGSRRGTNGLPDGMLRDSEGRVLFMQSWWLAAFRRAAQAISLGVDLVSRIQMDPVADGRVGLFARSWKSHAGGGVTHHEAFLPDTVVAFRALVPDELTRDEFFQLLSTVGTFYGISPYGFDHGYGRFTVFHDGGTDVPHDSHSSNS